MFLHKPLCCCDYIIFFNSMAFGNLQHSIISCVSFSIIKIPFLSLKNLLYFFFFFYNVFCFFYHFLIIFNAVSEIFKCPVSLLTSFIFLTTIQLYLFFIIILYYCNTTFSPSFFCNFYNHFVYTQKKIFFYYLHKVINNFLLFSPIKNYSLNF